MLFNRTIICYSDGFQLCLKKKKKKTSIGWSRLSIQENFSSLFIAAFMVAFMKVILIFVVQLLRRVWLFVTPWTATHQASLSFPIPQSLFKFTSTESVILSNRLILCHPLFLLPSIFPSIGVFSNALGGQSTGASESVLGMNIQGWFPLGLTGLLFAVQGTLKSLLPHHNFFCRIKLFIMINNNNFST